MRLRPRSLALAATLAVGGALVAGAAPATADPDVTLKAATVGRVAGGDRIATAIAAAQSFAGGKAQAVVLARSDNFADSLGAAPLASDKGGPLLLTDRDSLRADVRAQIDDVLVAGGKVYVLGGTSAISTAVEDQVKGLVGAGNVQRVAGGDRYATAVEIAKLLPQAKDVAFVTGNNFPDGLSAGALMGVVDKDTNHSLGVVLLTNDTVMPDVTKNYVNGQNFAVRVAVGGQAVTAAASAGIQAGALRGSDRYDTSALVAEQFTSTKFFTDATTVVGVATGEGWADALSGSALMAFGGGPMVLTRPDALPDRSAAALRTIAADARAKESSVSQALIFGGTSVVRSGVDAQVTSALQ